VTDTEDVKRKTICPSWDHQHIYLCPLPQSHNHRIMRTILFAYCMKYKEHPKLLI